LFGELSRREPSETRARVPVEQAMSSGRRALATYGGGGGGGGGVLRTWVAPAVAGLLVGALLLNFTSLGGRRGSSGQGATAVNLYRVAWAGVHEDPPAGPDAGCSVQPGADFAVAAPGGSGAGGPPLPVLDAADAAACCAQCSAHAGCWVAVFASAPGTCRLLTQAQADAPVSGGTDVTAVWPAGRSLRAAASTGAVRLAEPPVPSASAAASVAASLAASVAASLAASVAASVAASPLPSPLPSVAPSLAASPPPSPPPSVAASLTPAAAAAAATLPAPPPGGSGGDETPEDLKDTAIVTMATGDTAGRLAVAMLQSLRDSRTQIPNVIVLLVRGGLGSGDCQNPAWKAAHGRSHVACHEPGVVPAEIVSEVYLDAMMRLGVQLMMVDPLPRTKYTGALACRRAEGGGGGHRSRVGFAEGRSRAATRL